MIGHAFLGGAHQHHRHQRRLKAIGEEVLDLVLAGKLKHEVDSVVSLEGAPEALKRIHGPGAKGKVIVKVL